MRKAVPILLLLACIALIALLVLAPKILQVCDYVWIYSKLPSSRHTTVLAQENSSSAYSAAPSSVFGQSGGSLQQSQRLSELQQEVERLKDILAQAQASKGDKSAAPAIVSTSIAEDPSNTSVTISLLKFLGVQPFFAGISWDPLLCMPPYKAVWPNLYDETIDNITAQISKELVDVLAKIKGVRPESIDPKKPYHKQWGSTDDMVWGSVDEHVYASDPKFAQWRASIMPVLAKYMVGPDKTMVISEACPKLRGKRFRPQDMGTPAVDCSDLLTPKAMMDTLGYYALPAEPIHEIAHGLLTVGTCSSQIRNHKNSYAHWLRTERMFNPDWMTFAVETPEQDAVVLLFDVLYEKLAVFTKQYWLGVITMQNPFDMYSIQDIIFTTRPTLMIETGTANGGSALLWASIMHLSDMEDSKIVTLDMNPPKWEAGSVSWGGRAREDPTNSSLWKKHVTFLEGSSVDDRTVEKVKAMAKDKKVMVLLDSHHTELHVTAEMDVYCPMVSIGCYCIVEDTKMSRWSSTGPLESVKIFLAKHPEFELDRSRELLYSHHTLGYLKRIA